MICHPIGGRQGLMPRGLNFRAFTLVEVLASIVLITIGIVATLQTLGALT
ncbi:type IV pilus modification PilV family protein, partial [Vibrio parahaemolyticus]